MFSNQPGVQVPSRCPSSVSVEAVWIEEAELCGKYTLAGELCRGAAGSPHTETHRKSTEYSTLYSTAIAAIIAVVQVVAMQVEVVATESAIVLVAL